MSVAKITDYDIKSAIRMRDVNHAALALQTIAGITDGGLASIMLDQAEELWHVAHLAQREIWLRTWLKVEASLERELETIRG